MGAGGQHLAAAFDAVSAMPALAESRRRLLRASEASNPSGDELAAAIEADAALAIQVMRAANNGGGPHGRTGGVRQAVDALSADRIHLIVERVDTYDPIERPNALSGRHERFRRHAVATRHAAERIAELVRLTDRDELAVAAIERHHSAKARGHAAAIRLADLIVHYASGDPVAPEAIVEAGEQLGMDRAGVIPLLYEFPHFGTALKRHTDPCPLSDREVDALRGLADGKVYKQIAEELTLSVSTIRTHLCNVYRKIGAVDRAQAVLIAHEHGWI